MKYLFRSILLLLLIAGSLQAQVSWQIKKDTAIKWYYYDGDEFSTRFLNTDIWKFGMPWGGTRELSLDLLYKPESIEQTDGHMIITTRLENNRVKLLPYEVDSAYLKRSGKKLINGEYDFKYTSGVISTHTRYKYGLFEMRFKNNGQHGMWPAFWVYGGDPNEEIDFFELKGERDNQIHVDVHCPNGCDNYKGGFLNLKKNWGGWVPTKDNLSQDWNIISAEWQPGYVKWYLNGQPIAYFKGDFKTSQNLIINSAVAKDNGAFSPGPDSKTSWPSTFEIDYVRIWSKEDTVARLPKNDYTRFETSTTGLSNNNLYKTELKKKLKFVYNDKELATDEGSITLLPLGISKYSLSMLGKNLGPVKVEICTRNGDKQLGVTLENTNYFVLDLKDFATGMYVLKLMVAGKTLTHEIPVIDPATMPTYKQQ